MGPRLLARGWRNHETDRMKVTVMRHKPVAVLEALFAFLVGCDLAGIGNHMEVIPGMTWEYDTIRHSRLVWHEHGVSMAGNLFIDFRQYGFSIVGDSQSLHVDLRTNSPVSDSEALGSGSPFGVMDASSAMGIFSKESHQLFLDEMTALQTRVKQWKER